MNRNHGSSRGRLLRSLKPAGSLATTIAVCAICLGAGGLEAQAATQSDNFNDGNDTAPTIAWQRYDPIGSILGSSYAVYSFPGGNTYQIQAVASPDPVNYRQGRGGSIAPGDFTSFYESVDVVNWDDTVHQVFGILARVGTPGPGTTTGYLFNWDNGTAGSTTAGDMDIVRLDAEYPTDLDDFTVFGNDSIHLVTGHSYRFVFMGVGETFRGQVYDLTNTAIPLVDYGVTDPFYDPNGATHVSGPSGLMVANNASPTYDGPADATFDNFLVTDGELLSQNWPLLTITMPSPGTVNVSWPMGGTFNLYSSASLTAPDWGSPLTPTGTNGAENVYTVSPATETQFFNLVP